LPSDPEQGWKLHIAATILTAEQVLARVGPVLRKANALYKAPLSLRELDELNRGLLYGYTQVGKFMTVYPSTAREAILLAEKLHELTRGVSAPAIPFDGRYRSDSCIYYRYGAFKPVVAAEGEMSKSIRNPNGELCSDSRDVIKPEWADDLFVIKKTNTRPASPTLLQTTFKVFRALKQRGRGGVYQAIDISSVPPRLCIIKEGRKHGEVDWEGRDGCWRIKHEAKVIAQLRRKGLKVPRVYSSFAAAGNCYLVQEFIEGEDLGRWLARRKRRLSVKAALILGARLAEIVATIHDAGWVWRDCKPGNLIINRARELWPIDYEGACPLERPDPLPWGTVPYVAPEATAPFAGQSRLPEDLYALGAVVYFLLTGRPADGSIPAPLSRFRRKISPAVSELVMALLHLDPDHRPSARSAAATLAQFSK
jgi:serine/threonine protein kinase